MEYSLIKSIHLTCVVLTFLSFSLRYYWMLKSDPLLGAKLVRILPHFIDTILLISAIVLSLRLHQYPFVDHWLTAKVIALLVYIYFGTMALKRGKTFRQRALFGILAYLSFFYIVVAALSKSAWAWLL